MSELRAEDSLKLLNEWQAASNIVGKLVGWEKDSVIQTGLVEGLDQRGSLKFEWRMDRFTYTSLAT